MFEISEDLLWHSQPLTVPKKYCRWLAAAACHIFIVVVVLLLRPFPAEFENQPLGHGESTAIRATGIRAEVFQFAALNLIL